MNRTADTLAEMYRAARARFGHQGWWPGQTPLEVCVGAILTQNTNWSNVEKAIANLKAAGCLSVEAIHARPAGKVAELIRPAGYFNVKARRLKNFIARVHEGFGDDLGAFLDRPVQALREDLLSISGIGRETADSMILYAAGKPTFVVDAYTFRVLLRHGLIGTDYDYEMVKDLLESSLPEDPPTLRRDFGVGDLVALYNDFHAQFVAVGKHYCKPKPRCPGCPLEHLPHDPRAGMEDV